MFQKLKFIFLLLLSAGTGFAQIKEINGIQLSPEQQKAIKMALENQAISADDLHSSSESDQENDFTFTPRTKDLKRINAIPSVPTEKEAILKYLAKLTKAIEQNVETDIKTKVNEYAQNKPTVEINQTAVLTWYQKQEDQALLLALKAAQKMPDSTMVLNNLAALLNMSRMEELAIPILKYSQKKKEKNPVTLNNLGQAYLGMGAIPEAELYLKECLSVDVKHPEATRSMGVVELSKGNKAGASAYFEQDLKDNLRESSFDWLKKARGRQNIRLNDIRKDFLKRKKSGSKDFFGLIALDEMRMPIFPLTCDKSTKWQEDLELYTKALADEYQYWINQATTQSEDEKLISITKPEVYYSWLVNEVVHELTNTYGPELLPSNDLFIESMVTRTLEYQDKLNAVNCPDPPDGADIEVLKAYDRKCCALKSAVINNYMAAHNEDVRKNFEFRNGQWKIYLNELINTIEICPTPDNKKLVYQNLAHYINFLQASAGMVAAEDMPSGCDEMTLEEAETAIKTSKRKLELKCPAWLHYELPFPGVGSITMNCSEFQVEATPIGIVKAGYKKTFKDQSSTLYVGVGPKLAAGHFSLSAGVQGYLVFDRYEQLVNTGISAETKFELPHGIAELSATAKVEMNSGYSHEVKSDSRWIQQVKSTFSKY